MMRTTKGGFRARACVMNEREIADVYEDTTKGGFRDRACVMNERENETSMRTKTSKRR